MSHITNEGLLYEIRKRAQLEKEGKEIKTAQGEGGGKPLIIIIRAPRSQKEIKQNLGAVLNK